MPQVAYSRNAASDLDRLHRFWVEKNPQAAARAIVTIIERLGELGRFPRLGRVDPDRPQTRELFMRFGTAGYVARYRIDDDTVIVMAVRHAREAGYMDE